MDSYAWIVWLSLGLIIFIIELVATTYYLLWAGVAALCAGLLALLFPQYAWLPWLSFALVGLVLLYLTLRYLPRLRGREVVPSNVDALVGRHAHVIEDLDPVANTGRVRIDSEEWRARAPVAVPVGATVEIREIRGATLIVAPLSTPSPEEEPAAPSA